MSHSLATAVAASSEETLIGALQETSLDDMKSEKGRREEVAHPQSLPRCITKSFRIDGVVTDITLQIFQERIVVTCSQLKGRIGHWLLCKMAGADTDSALVSMQPNKKYSWDVTHLLGAASRDDPLLTVYAKHVTERIVEVQQKQQQQGHVCNSVLLGLALDATHCKEAAFFHTLVDVIGLLYAEAATAVAAS